MSLIQVRGARTHNLKNINVDLPRGKLVVITGLSGSGKSSLAFDTLYAEGQRRYVESLSTYARQFLHLMEKPDVDSIDGLSPAIAIDQKSASHNPRSTVGTITEIHDYLRLLYARVGEPHCIHHPQQPLLMQSVARMVELVMAEPAGSRLLLLAPQPRESLAERLQALRSKGFIRFRLDDQLVEAEQLGGMALGKVQNAEVVVDRFKVAPGMRARLADSLETALGLADGRALLFNQDAATTQGFTSRFRCPLCGWRVSELEPRLFSFNSPVGACTTCDGLGEQEYFDPRKVVAHPSLSLASGAIPGWDARNRDTFAQLARFASTHGIDTDVAFESLPEAAQQAVLLGESAAAQGKDGGSVLQPTAAHLRSSRRGAAVRAASISTTKGETKAARAGQTTESSFRGILPELERRWNETESAVVREHLARLRGVRPCIACQGTRLKPEARHVTVGGSPIHALSAMRLSQALDWFARLQLPAARADIGARIVREIGNRLRFLNDVGLGYLSLDRSAQTLSGGESQRIRLASQVGSGLTGVLYVLDEPSIGLHQSDNGKLLDTLMHLRDLGNSVVVVEHDEETIRRADFVVDLGPGAGEHGGHVMAAATPDIVAQQQDSLTGRYLSGSLRIAPPKRRMTPGAAQLSIRGARGNNLRALNVDVPLGLLVCVTGVSGSGKSTLVNDTLASFALAKLNHANTSHAPVDEIDGIEQLDKAVVVDQSPIGRTPRSNPATYTGLFTPIRELFASTPLAREHGFDAGRFSFNVSGGRCEACQGDGVIKVEMHFLADMFVPCETCHGKRYNQETLEIRYKGRNIAEVLDLTVEQALDFFGAVPFIARKLQTLSDVGLSYIRLGQNATTLSGGEAQRVKLALELSKRDTGRTLYILDEPTTGLHFHDVAMLLDVLMKLRDAGNSIVVIEHNLDVLKVADWLIDLGPGGGDEGGQLVACGTPEHIAATATSATGRFLKHVLAA